MKRGAVLLVLAIVIVAAYAALVYLPAHQSPPSAGAIYTAQIRSTSSIDATFTGVQISGDGHTITWVLTQAEAASVTLIELQVSIQNVNVPLGTETFVASLVSCPTVLVNNHNEDMCATTASGRDDISYALTQSGAPTGAQSGTTFTSSDWPAGASDILDASANMDPNVVSSMQANTDYSIVYNMGGVTIAGVLRVTS